MLPLYQRGVLIGEEAAGDYYGCTAGFRQEIILPNSKVRLPLGMVTYYYAAAKYKHIARGMVLRFCYRILVIESEIVLAASPGWVKV